MSETLYSVCTESPTEKSSPFSGDTILSNYASENITESINNNNLISSINSMVTFQHKLKQRNTKNTRELPNEILLKIFNNLDDLKDNLNLRCVNKKFKLLSEVKLYDIIEEKIQSLESKKKSLERRLSHMKNHLCPRLSHYKVFLNVISRSDVSELCNLPQPPKEVKYIFSVLYILYSGGKNCYCIQCMQNKNTLSPNNSRSRSNSISIGNIIESNLKGKELLLTSPSRPSVTVSDLSSFNGSSNNSSRTNSNTNSRRNSFDISQLQSQSTMKYTRKRKGSVQSDIELHPKKSLDHSPSPISQSPLPTATPNTTSNIITTFNINTTSNTNITSSSSTTFISSPNIKTPIKKCNTTIDTSYSTVSKFGEIDEEIEIPNWEEVRQVINKNDFRNWVMNLHSKLDTVPKEHILLANNLLNKPRTLTNSNSTSNSSSAPSEYDNLRLTYDRMLIVSQIGYKILLFIEAIIQSFFLTERFEEQKNSISQVYKQIHQWKDLQLQCKN